MARTLPKERFLPSLLDRLTDDDPVNNSIQRQNQQIHRIEKELMELSKRQMDDSEPDFQKKHHQLLQQLEQLRLQQNVLSASLSSLRELRACVKRDLDWLLNASQYSPQQELEGYPEIARSVLNYGLPDLTGKTVSGFDIRHLERLLKQVIIDFEPRIIKKTLVIRILADKSMFDHNAVTFEIEGELWAEPQPLHLHLRTEFELESGNVSVYDYRQTGAKR
ncbi:type VI secretion system baseplate subunit TssE [Methylomarinum vadi]|uniref:type VI secretion system baseplate subunit TssE n=1 Tax=Methylomarinum vadi TaxID=438855 RepID=UPI000690C73A|nr:type VI secretion system baseplate subunit TssE [Methylomarinum vadi]